MAEQLDRNSTSFPVALSARLRELFARYRALRSEPAPQSSVAKILKYYQYLVRAVMTEPEFGIGDGARGLLVYHTMGMGKTFLAVATAMSMWDIRPPLVLAAKALQKNFAATVRKFVALMDPDTVDLKARQDAAVGRFQFVTLDAHNMAVQLARATTGVDDAGSLRGRLLIVDEAHNLFRAIINNPRETSNARRLYNMVMAARNLRILFLTGTPASKDPFELVPCFNMLAGYDLLPTQYEVFYRNYVDREKGIVINRGKLANRLLGLVSYATHSSATEPPDDSTGDAMDRSSDFPEKLELITERPEMSSRQFLLYLAAREAEDAKGPNDSGGKPSPSAAPPLAPNMALPGTDSGGGQTYFVKSRSLGNFAPPRGYTGDAAELPDAAFDAEASPKMTRVVANLGRSPGPALVYSQFKGIGGLASQVRYLEAAGYAPLEAAVGGDEVAATADEDATPELSDLRDANYINYNILARQYGEKALEQLPHDSAHDSAPDVSLVNGIVVANVFAEAASDGLMVSFAPPRDNYAPVGLVPPTNVGPRPRMLGDTLLWISTPQMGAKSWYDFASRQYTDSVDLNSKAIVGYRLDNARMLQIRTPKKLAAFHRRYATCPEQPEDLRLCTLGGYIDWGRVAKRWGGVALEPYLYPVDKSHPIDSKTFKLWYSSMDAATFIVWDAAVVLETRVLFDPRNRSEPPAEGGADESPAEVPAESPDEAPAEAPDEAPAEAPDESPAEASRVRIKPRFAVISGDVKIAERERIQMVLNSPANAHGELIQVLLVSKTGAEGLDLKGIRQIHILEPYWDKAREDQVVARGVRLGSHLHLPPDERTVQPYLYIASPNTSLVAEMRQVRENAEAASGRPLRAPALFLEDTVDEKFHQRALSRLKINVAFRDVLQSVAIECIPNGHGGCRQCAPTGAALFDEDPVRDLTLPDPCQEIAEKEADARRLEYDGQEYYFREVPAAPAGYEFYEFDSALDAYSAVPHASPLYIDLAQAIPSQLST